MQLAEQVNKQHMYQVILSAGRTFHRRWARFAPQSLHRGRKQSLKLTHKVKLPVFFQRLPVTFSSFAAEHDT